MDLENLSILSFESNPIWNAVMAELDDAAKSYELQVRSPSVKGDDLARAAGSLDALRLFAEHLEGLRQRSRQQALK
jgi:hypothetical protein